jgi:hypothetical protein
MSTKSPWAARIALVALAAAVLVAAPRRAEAINWIIKQDETHGKWNLTPTIAVAPWYFSPGLRLGIPIAKNGFIPSRNDEVKIEIGVNFQLWWNHVYYDPCHQYCDPSHPHYDPAACDRCRSGLFMFRLAFPVMLRWEFYLTRVWSVYAGMGMEFGIPMNRYYRDGFGPDDWVWVVAVVGTRFTVKEWFAFRLEMGTIGLFVFGFEFMFG